MSLDETLVFTEDRSSEPEVGGQIRGGAPAYRQTKSGDDELSSENLGNLLRRVSKTSISEVDNLIGELQTLRRKLQTDGDRIQRDIAEYAELSQQVMQLTTIISDSVKKLPHGPRIN
jgi:chemotaxis protein histidine kinase CheA